jgi:hypothetical protein
MTHLLANFSCCYREAVLTFLRFETVKDFFKKNPELRALLFIIHCSSFKTFGRAMAYQALNDFSRQEGEVSTRRRYVSAPAYTKQGAEKFVLRRKGGREQTLMLQRRRRLGASSVGHHRSLQNFQRRSIRQQCFLDSRTERESRARASSIINQSERFFRHCCFASCPRRRTSSVAASFPDVTGRKPFFRCKNTITE